MINSSSAVSPSADSSNKSAAPTQPAATDFASAEVRQQQQNKAILEAQINLSVKDEPLSLILKTAIDSINEKLEPFLGANAIESAVESGLDVSPEATAERIVSQSTAFFSAFQQQNKNLDFEQQLEKFIDVISGGIDQGFSEARDILEGLQVLEGDIATNIDKTYDLVQSGLDAFQQQQIENNSTIT